MSTALLSAQDQSGLLTAPYRRGAELLELQLGPDATGATPVVADDFHEYLARYGTQPADPRYVLVLKKDSGDQPFSIQVETKIGAAPPVTVTVKIPAESIAGQSFLIPIVPPVSSDLRVLSLRQ